MDTNLFQPVRLGRYALTNRVVMAPLTRSRARADGVPHSVLMMTYYRQRASAGLIISEGTNISPQARGYAFTPAYSARHNRRLAAGHRGGSHRRRAYFRPALACRAYFASSLQEAGALPVALPPSGPRHGPFWARLRPLRYPASACRTVKCPALSSNIAMRRVAPGSGL